MEEFGNYWIERVDVIGSGSFGKVEKKSGSIIILKHILKNMP